MDLRLLTISSYSRSSYWDRHHSNRLIHPRSGCRHFFDPLVLFSFSRQEVFQLKPESLLEFFDEVLLLD